MKASGLFLRFLLFSQSPRITSQLNLKEMASTPDAILLLLVKQLPHGATTR